MPKRSEVATVEVGGRRFDDWESVWVQHPWGGDAASFRFTAAERDPDPDIAEPSAEGGVRRGQWDRLQFKPGDECAIYLGNQLACAGIILTRQAAYDANQHAVQLSGRGRTWYAARGSILEKTNFDGKTFEEIARAVIKPFGVDVKTIGVLDAIPFERMQTEPGEALWVFLERIARQKKVVLGSDHLGSFLLIGDHSYNVDNNLIEGVNILRCQAIITAEYGRSKFVARGQTAASDPQYGAAASEQEARVDGTAKRYSPLLVVLEQPVWNLAEVQKRAQAEAQWNEGCSLQVSITVQGWQTSAGVLWRAGNDYLVRSPMAMLDQVLKAETVTFTQDVNQGTLTTLDLVAPWKLNDKGIFPGKDVAADPNTAPPAKPVGPAQASDPPPERLPE